MIPPEKVNPKQLSKMLIEKHQEFFENYTREFNILMKLNVLNEKQEQLKYWMNSIDNEEDPNFQKYINEKKLTDIEIANLENEIREFHSDGILNNSRLKESRSSELLWSSDKDRSSWLEQKITLHKDTMDYWNCRYKDFVAVRRKPDERKGSEGKGKRPKARDRQKK